MINKDLVIATMTDDVPFNVELTVENGRGYVPASEHFHNDPEVGVIPLDAAFSPIVRVRHHIEETRVGQRTNYDRMNLEIWTNGTVSPSMALVEAAKILRKHLNCFITYRINRSNIIDKAIIEINWQRLTFFLHIMQTFMRCISSS